MANKFKVGDIIKGNEKSNQWYGITTVRMTKGKVVEVVNEKEIRIKVLEHKDSEMIDGIRYRVCSDCFDLVNLNSSIHIYTDGTTTTAILKDGKKTIKTAHAKCSPDDTYDFAIGAKLAFDRLIGVEGKPVREVKRKAKVGEYIKITHALYSFGKIGDILKVDGRDNEVYVLGKNHPRNTNRDYEHWQYGDSCYVVLENYKPENEDKPLEVIINGEKYIKEA